MKKSHSIFYYSLLSVLVALPCASYGAIRVGNVSRTNAQGYQQVNETRYKASPEYQQQLQQAQQAAVAVAPSELPIAVTNKNLEQQIKSGHGPVGVEQLERCSLIYPDGKFEWAKPTIGAGMGGAPTCTAVIEMRAIGAGPNGSELVVARANLAAGQAFKCNISEFPLSTVMESAGDFLFPADAEPTMDDVVAVMNQEQKQNSGLKIAAGALIGGLGGNVAGKNDAGKDNLLGTDKGKVQGTIIGALSGAAIMAGNSYAGKVGGDVILSTGVNAAAGGVMGNMVASGDAVLRIEPCALPDGQSSTCLWGLLIEEEKFDSKNETAFYNLTNENIIVCKNKPDETYQDCMSGDLISIKLAGHENTSLEELAKQNFINVKSNPGNLYSYNVETKQMTNGAVSGTDTYAKISTAARPGKRYPAMIAGVSDKTFGYKRSDWSALKNNIKLNKIYGRDSMAKAFELAENINKSIDSFYPMYVDSEDGGIIDLGNKARLKATLTGAGIGGAMGAFVGYQGAQSDIETRWLSEVRAYKDSLQKVYCATGGRFLSFYNDMLEVPELK